MSISLYNTREMLEALKIVKEPKTFILDTFFTEVHEAHTEKIDIDIQKGTRRMAPFVAPNVAGKPVEKQGFSTNTYTPPMTKDNRVLTGEDMVDRMPGETIYQSPDSARSQLNRQQEIELADQRRMAKRSEEWMACQAVLNGQVVVSGDGVNDTITFGRDAAHSVTLSGNFLWDSGHSDSHPLKNQRTWRRLIAKANGGVQGKIVNVFGTDALEAYLDHPDVKSMFDKRRIDLGTLSPEQRAEGVYLGTLPEFGEIWCYEDWYIDANGVEQPMIPANTILMGMTGARCTRHFGAINDPARKIKFVGQYYPKAWAEEDPPKQIQALWSRPLPVPHQIDGFVKAVVTS